MAPSYSVIIKSYRRSQAFVAFRAGRFVVEVYGCFETRYGNKTERIASAFHPTSLSRMDLQQIACLFSTFESFVDALSIREFGEDWTVCSDKSNWQVLQIRFQKCSAGPVVSHLHLINYKNYHERSDY